MRTSEKISESSPPTCLEQERKNGLAPKSGEHTASDASKAGRGMDQGDEATSRVPFPYSFELNPNDSEGLSVILCFE